MDVAVDVSALGEESLKNLLHFPKDQLKKFCEADIETANKVMHLGLFTWRPGSSDAGPLCLALGMGPGDLGEIILTARPGRLLRRAPCQESALNLELLSNEFPPEEHNFRDIAVRRCTQLQQLTQGLAANLMAGHGSG